jgi:hypothetical protein
MDGFSMINRESKPGVSLVMADPQVTKGFNTRSWSFMTWTFWGYASEQTSLLKGHWGAPG